MKNVIGILILFSCFSANALPEHADITAYKNCAQRNVDIGYTAEGCATEKLKALNLLITDYTSSYDSCQSAMDAGEYACKMIDPRSKPLESYIYSLDR